MMLVISTFYIYQRIPKLIMLFFLRLLPEVSTWRGNKFVDSDAKSVFFVHRHDALLQGCNTIFLSFDVEDTSETKVFYTIFRDDGRSENLESKYRVFQLDLPQIKCFLGHQNCTFPKRASASSMQLEAVYLEALL